MKTLQHQASRSSRSPVLIIGFVVTIAMLNFSSPSLSAQECGTAWRIVPCPNFGADNNELYGVDAASANDVWAVGRYDDPAGYKTLSLRWNGSAWNVVPTPNVGSSFNQLFSVAAISPDNAWAVGASSNDNLIHQPLIAHWEGTEWSIVPAALAPGSSAFLYGIAAIGADDIWAVGYIQVGFSAQQPLTMHWDGTSWSLVTSPSTSPANRDILWAVSALAADNIWATGYSADAVTGEIRTLIQHWNGSAWSIVPSPNPTGSIYNFSWGIEAVSATDVWVMGRSYAGDLYPTLIERWNGSAWSITPSPSKQFYNELFDAAALSSTDVWAVGRNGGGFSDNIAMVMHWNGSAWSVVANPNPPGATENNFLYSVEAVSPQDVWAVGTYFKDKKFRTLIERYSPCILAATGAISRKTHGAAGDFDVDLPLTGNPGIECRNGGTAGNHRIIVTFPNAVTCNDAQVTGGTDSVSSFSVNGGGTEVTVNLTGIGNAQMITVTLIGLNDGINTGDVAVQMSVLPGDTTADGAVNSSDISEAKTQSGQVAAPSNFRTDVTTNGVINSSDISLAKSKSGSGLSP
jgi:hypothetical protein